MILLGKIQTIPILPMAKGASRFTYLVRFNIEKRTSLLVRTALLRKKAPNLDFQLRSPFLLHTPIIDR